MNGYGVFLEERGLCDDVVRRISEGDDYMPVSDPLIHVAPSDIAGMGLFSTNDMALGTTVAARINGRRTEAGRYTNHSDTPNAEAIVRGEDIYLSLIKDVSTNEEITVDYRSSELAAHAAAYRRDVTVLESAILEMEQVEIEITHTFANGVYARGMFVPAGTTLTGKIHRYPCINIVSQGKLRFVSDEGIFDVEAPATFVSGAGVKKAIYAIEDSVWTNCHPWDGEADLEEIERQLIAPSYEALDLEREEKT